MNHYHPGRRSDGIGTFAGLNSPPALIVVQMPPLHTSDQWELFGRPFWFLACGCADRQERRTREWDAYASTMTPTYCPLSVIVVPPLAAVSVSAGYLGEERPARWTAVGSMKIGLRMTSKESTLNPVRVIFPDAHTLRTMVQRYAVAGDIRRDSPRPVRPEETKWKPPGERTVWEHIDTIRDDDAGKTPDLGGNA